MNELVLPLLLLVAGLSVLGVVLLARWFEGRSWHSSLTAFRLRLPADVSVDAVAGWLSAVNAATHAPLFSLLSAPPVALEVVASRHDIEHVLLVPRTMQAVVLASVRACLPGVRIDELPDYLHDRPRFLAAAEGALSSHTRPLGAERAEVAISALLAAMQPLHGTERVAVQWIITGGGIPRPVASVAAKRQDNGWFFDGRMLGDAEAVRAERLKQKEPLLRACLRVGVAASDRARANSVYSKVWAALRILNAPGVGVVRRWWLPAGLVSKRLRALAVKLSTEAVSDHWWVEADKGTEHLPTLRRKVLASRRDRPTPGSGPWPRSPNPTATTRMSPSSVNGSTPP